MGLGLTITLRESRLPTPPLLVGENPSRGCVTLSAEGFLKTFGRPTEQKIFPFSPQTASLRSFVRSFVRRKVQACARVQSGDRERARAASVASTRRSLSHFVLPSFPKSVSGLLASNLDAAHLLHFNQNKPICVLNSAQPKCKVSCASAVSCFI